MSSSHVQQSLLLQERSRLVDKKRNYSDFEQESDRKDVYSKHFRGALSGLKQFLTTESPLKIIKKSFYFTVKALFVLKIFKFLP